jgi:hypothetical protein
VDELLSVNELALDDVIDCVTGSYQSENAVFAVIDFIEEAEFFVGSHEFNLFVISGT